jgi:elongator complex protein 1
MREILNARNTDNCYLLAIMTTYVKTDQLAEVLTLIQSLMGEPKPPKAPHLKQKLTKLYAEDALKYVCWLVDADKLFDLALSVYDFKLVLMVAKYT